MKRRNKLKTIFIWINVLVISGIFILLFLNMNFNFSGMAVYDFKETNASIKDYYQKIVNVDYSPGYEKEISFTVFNTEHKNMKVLLNVEGDLSGSVELPDRLVDFLPSEISKNFKYNIKIPEIKEPGLHTARIVALMVPNVASGEDYAGSSSKIVSEANVYVPYPGKYIESEMNVLNAEENSTAKFIIDVENHGKLKINKISAVIDIFTVLGERVASLKSDLRSLDIETTAQLNAEWKVNSFPGDYIAKYDISYDEETRSFEKKFSIGAKNISIEGLIVNNFQLGGIAKLQILVDNKWNKDIEGVFAELIVYNKDGQVMADVKSASERIASLSKKELIAYWDTAEVEEGEYTSKLSIKYENQSSDKEMILQVGQDSINVFGVGYAIRPKIMSGSTMTMVLIILVIILLIANLSWFVFYKRMMIKKKN